MRSFNSLSIQVMKKLKKTSKEYKYLKLSWNLYLRKYQGLEKIIRAKENVVRQMYQTMLSFKHNLTAVTTG